MNLFQFQRAKQSIKCNIPQQFFDTMREVAVNLDGFHQTFTLHIQLSKVRLLHGRRTRTDHETADRSNSRVTCSNSLGLEQAKDNGDLLIVIYDYEITETTCSKFWYVRRSEFKAA